jgi:hypothetical protein
MAVIVVGVGLAGALQEAVEGRDVVVENPERSA